ncbi:MAG: hypothetical protein MZV63_47070 [Marinilabiliales bacterium]|nr:hypothetical protein [Marinilabiliales bacterium]
MTGLRSAWQCQGDRITGMCLKTLPYNEIEPRLNNMLFSKFLRTDKNSYDLFLRGEVKIPEAVLRCINGVLYTLISDLPGT